MSASGRMSWDEARRLEKDLLKQKAVSDRQAALLLIAERFLEWYEYEEEDLQGFCPCCGHESGCAEWCPGELARTYLDQKGKGSW